MQDIKIDGKLKPHKVIIKLNEDGSTQEVMYKYHVIDNNGRILQYKSIKLDNYIDKKELPVMKSDIKKAVDKIKN
jgi:hypothetical protein